MAQHCAHSYRLGVLGFSAEPPRPGAPPHPPHIPLRAPDHLDLNVGLKDQALAARWVKDNIVAWGGDPERVSLLLSSLFTVAPCSRELRRERVSTDRRGRPQRRSHLGRLAPHLLGPRLLQRRCVAPRDKRALSLADTVLLHPCPQPSCSRVHRPGELIMSRRRFRGADHQTAGDKLSRALASRRCSKDDPPVAGPRRLSCARA